MNKSVLKVFNIFEKAGYEIYLVGGAVRDIMMNNIPKDYDFCTNAKPEDILNLCEKYKLNYYLTGIQHGTITVKVDDMYFEITTYRIDGKYSDHRRPDAINFTNNIYDDVSRRDFTINSICMNKSEEILDIYNGVADIKNKIVRTVGNPDDRFNEDALRIVRCIRFAIRFGYNIEDATLYSVIKNRSLLNKIAIERINSELYKILSFENSYLIAKDYYYILETIYNIIGYHGVDYVTTSTLLEKCKKKNINNIYVKMACLFYNKFCNIDNLKNSLYNLKCDKIMINNVLNICKIKSIPYDLQDLHIFLINNNFLSCDILKDMAKLLLSKSKYNIFIKNLYYILDNNLPITVRDLKINGNDLIDLGFQNKEIGKTLNNILIMVARKLLNNNKDELLKYSKYIKKNYKTKERCKI